MVTAAELHARYADYTLVPLESWCTNIELIERARRTAGAIVECGVWRGGMMAGMASWLGDGRDYWLYDSFEGLPPVAPLDGTHAAKWQASGKRDNCRAPVADVRQVMATTGVSPERIHIVPGWFSATLPTFQPPPRIAVLRLDADWYSSTAECLNSLYQHVAPKGLVIIDDYFTWDGCSRAVHRFLGANQLADRIQRAGKCVAYLVKQADGAIRPIDPAGGDSLDGPT